jgi:hypothetical protein
MEDYSMIQERLDYKAAIAKKDWDKALKIVLASPAIFGIPPKGVPASLAAVATDPQEPEWMVLEWSVQKNDCKGSSSCREYKLRTNQFDHKPAGLTEEEIQAWFQQYVQNRQDHAPSKDQLGQTLYLLKVEKIVQITDFNGVKL